MPKIDKLRAKKKAAPRAAKAKWEAARVRARVERYRRQYVAAKRAQAPAREMLSKLRSLDAEDDQLASFHIVDGQMNLRRIRARRLLGMMKDQIATSDDHSYEYQTRVEFKFLWNQIASDQNEMRLSQQKMQNAQKGAELRHAHARHMRDSKTAASKTRINEVADRLFESGAEYKRKDRGTWEAWAQKNVADRISSPKKISQRWLRDNKGEIIEALELKKKPSG